MASMRPGGHRRVLGSAARTLSPSAAIPVNSKNQTALSPSTSSLSLDSQLSHSPLSLEPQDLGSRVSLGNGDSSRTASTAKLICPICEEEMVTLLQLNRHLDDDHQNLEEVEQDEVKNWFKTQMVKAKKFQPLAVLNQKLKGLDVFESNDTPPSFVPPSSNAAVAEPHRADPDELVTREHWQRPRPDEVCSEPICERRLGAINGSVNCRKCGRLFCEEHTMYQMKLSRSAQHEPVRGVWCRVCETCYKLREGYNDHNGLERDRTSEFAEIRRRNVDKSYLEISRLEKRLTKLTKLLTSPQFLEQESASGGAFWSLSGARNQRKLLEQSVVTWEEDAAVSHCPFCQQEFTSYTFRRHHCRLCGRVVCGDSRTGCSSEVGLNVATMADHLSEKTLGQMSLDVRMCKDCKTICFSKRDFANELAQRPPDLRAYENLVQFERGIRLMLPKFQRLLVALQDPDKPPTPTQLAEASKVRKRLTDSFSQYDIAARRIRDMPTKSKTQLRLQKAIYHQATNFIHLHMLPLKSLPKVLKHASPHGASPRPYFPSPGGRSISGLAAIKYNDLESASQASSNSAVSVMEAEEKSLRERLIVLEEQKFFVSEMVADANKHRRFDEVSSLAQNIEDLSHEIDQINGMLSQLDFAAVYTQSPAPSSPFGTRSASK
ncbi:hypothetical protein L228DRAFT_282083 [Xylona heveae TC161]|uniref:FYVE-type domain-containing protein n=1 Tax=Xylona heveae (strain CBS 132557 / TC161) TaxID=1328760 RepID=A0A165HDM5_XYLHT|nr:hypothetical protein L228DRAFT_282083 [Xylona heveae TC161]KZF23349.1 hypothetical protein L228DRAFT_282083 [Xylona heveae TC161]